MYKNHYPLLDHRPLNIHSHQLSNTQDRIFFKYRASTDPHLYSNNNSNSTIKTITISFRWWLIFHYLYSKKSFFFPTTDWCFILKGKKIMAIYFMNILATLYFVLRTQFSLMYDASNSFKIDRNNLEHVFQTHRETTQQWAQAESTLKFLRPTF